MSQNRAYIDRRGPQSRTGTVEPPARQEVWEEVRLNFPTATMPVVITGHEGGLTGLRFGTGSDHAGWLAGAEQDPETLSGAIAQLKAYAAGDLTDFDLTLCMAGTPFQSAVWSALRQIPYGQTVTYGYLAAEVGRPGSARAVGAAVGSNPIGIIVPCHRVIGANGALTGFAGGLDNKITLLAREGVSPRSRRPPAAASR